MKTVVPNPTQQCVRVLFSCLVSSLITLSSLQAGTVTIDFTQAGTGPLAPDFFASSGIIFPPGGSSGFVNGNVQGHAALISTGPVFGTQSISAVFLAGVTSLSARVALGFQVEAEFTLTAFDSSLAAISSTTFRLNQIQGDPGFAGFGFFDVNLGTLSRPASSFVLTAVPVRGPGSQVRAEFGAASFTFDVADSSSSFGLISFGLLGLTAFARIAQRAEESAASAQRSLRKGSARFVAVD